jgi:hypothetical protein
VPPAPGNLPPSLLSSRIRFSLPQADREGWNFKLHDVDVIAKTTTRN